jgi:hypothetical protein
MDGWMDGSIVQSAVPIRKFSDDFEESISKILN